VTVVSSPTSATSVGDIAVTFLRDGSIHLPPAPVFGGASSSLFGAHPESLDAQGHLVLSLGAILIRTGGVNVLVDLGWGPSELNLATVDASRSGRIIGGQLLDSLASSGLTVHDIDLVVFSHLHADHVGWLLSSIPAGTTYTFPRAKYQMAEAEWLHWTSASGSGWGGPSSEQLDALRPRLSFFADGQTIAPGLTAAITVGHTPGHSSFVVSSGGDRAIVLGDLMHCPLEITHPELQLRSDTDPDAAQRARDDVRRELAAGAIAIGPHFAPSVFGRVHDEGGVSSFVHLATRVSAI
jgi:glyoxylase-like metal-dependent hydrolase (beta-lactamase superfamily II)